jgi:septal ring factor EnvC (AmiA/AmiB activator)
MNFCRILLVPIFIIAGLIANAQEEAPAEAPTTLDGKYNQLMDNSETYQIYKVIKINELNAFWSEVVDSLQQNRQKIEGLQDRVDQLSQTITSQKNEIESVKAELDESLTRNDSIEFLGIQFSKTAYHILVWAIIILLAAGIIVVFTLYKRSHSVTARAQKDYQTIQRDFEQYKDKAREKQVKLKRELQTAVNNLEEARRGKSR